jgi:hypothetical protein
VATDRGQNTGHGQREGNQSVLTTELVFLVAILSRWFGFTIRRREWGSSLAVAGGLAGFLSFAYPGYGTLSSPAWEWAATGAASAALS